MAYNVGGIEFFDTFANLPTVGTVSQLYFTYDTNVFWLWTGSAYTSLPTVGGAPRINSVASSATPAINVATTDQFEVTALAVALTGFTITGTPVDGQQLAVRIKDNGTLRALAFGASFGPSGTVALLTTTVATKTHLSVFRYDAVKSLFIATFADATGY